MKTQKYHPRRNRFSVPAGLAMPISVALIAVLSGPVTTGRAAALTVSGTTTFNSTTTYSAVYDGYNSAGTLNITGGTLTNNGNTNPVVVGYNYAGTLNLSAGTLSAASSSGVSELLGDNATGTFVQTGEINSAAGAVEIGYNAGYNSTYSISNGTLTVGTTLQVSDDNNTSSFTQT